MTVELASDSIARNFSAAAGTYDDWALSQQLSADRLIAKLSPVDAPGPILDIGCGTGQLTSRLLDCYGGHDILGIDLAPEMVAFCRERWRAHPRMRFEVADGETFSWSKPFALMTSNCVLQWFRDVSASVARLAAQLVPGGLFAAAIPVKDSLPELVGCYQAVTGGGLPGFNFRPEECYEDALRQGGLTLRHGANETVQVGYPTALDVLRSFRGIGATLQQAKGYQPLSYGQTRNLTRRYAKLYGHPDGGVSVTYQMLFLIAEKVQ
jgi:malonyl-CoA O-methyltransferase